MPNTIRQRNRQSNHYDDLGNPIEYDPNAPVQPSIKGVPGGAPLFITG